MLYNCHVYMNLDRFHPVDFILEVAAQNTLRLPNWFTDLLLTNNCWNRNITLFVVVPETSVGLEKAENIC